MASLPSKVKNKVGARDKFVDQGLIADIANMDCNAILDVCNVEPVSAIFGDQIVNHRDLGSVIDQSSGNVGTDEAQTPGD